MKYLIESINCSGRFEGYNPGYIIQDNYVEVMVSVFMTTDSRGDVKAFSFKVTIQEAYTLSLDEIKNKAIEVAKENFEKVISA
ncbi:hypothetical protein [Xenorhabdus lircayensis]|uniref:Phage protein n=1 Tax=Xenorhabdus lircayensis TaxID=2763499 RepID=A0ABS0U556_9GAMM|nr:hypothetical protein [Xenorhabdus lircayensis]MBI6548604.1 hypothetical protein [Xenorhabdus lircayensis]